MIGQQAIRDWLFINEKIEKQFIYYLLFTHQMTKEVYTGLLSIKLVDVQSPSIVKKRTKSNIEIRNHKPNVSKHLRLTESKHQPTEGSSRRCAMCSTKKKPQRTKWI
ncbi:unnamed protein product [Macrosiphum euphorbiae]|uniref:Uncharacterized protein n=1 Tax=Macrosiphum euphorbiae TaxID=13131 RepID=A0AAV0WHU5_9HEMI|nr:unnamed protein product [Macrosiphum euphorbiae]